MGFKEELIEQFTPVNKGKVARDQLACTKQEESEPVRKYVQRMREDPKHHGGREAGPLRAKPTARDQGKGGHA